MRVHVYTCVRACMCVGECVSVCACVHVCMCISMCASVCMCLCVMSLKGEDFGSHDGVVYGHLSVQLGAAIL